MVSAERLVRPFFGAPIKINKSKSGIRAGFSFVPKIKVIEFSNI